MKTNPKANKLRQKLKSDEDKLLRKIDQETAELENQLTKALKLLGVASATLVASYVVYKLLAPASKTTPKPKVTKARGNSLIGQSILSMAIKGLLPVAITELNKLKNRQNNEPTHSAGRKKTEQ